MTKTNKDAKFSSESSDIPIMEYQTQTLTFSANPKLVERKESVITLKESCKSSQKKEKNLHLIDSGML